MRSWGIVRTSPSDPLPERLALIFRELQSVVARDRPHEIAVEDGFFGKNPRTALIIGQTRGIALVVAALSDVTVSLYPPAEVKLALTGSGAASKEQVAFMVRRLLRLSDEKIPADCTDALAVALCRSQRRRFDEKMRGNR